MVEALGRLYDVGALRDFMLKEHYIIIRLGDIYLIPSSPFTAIRC